MQRHQLVIDGNAGDAVNSTGWGATFGTVTNGGLTYNVYNAGSFAQLLTLPDLHRIVSTVQRGNASVDALRPMGSCLTVGWAKRSVPNINSGIFIRWARCALPNLRN